MRGLLLVVGIIPAGILSEIRGSLEATLRGTSWELHEDPVSLPREAFDRGRNQYNSTKILRLMKEMLPEGYSLYLTATDVDLYSGELNFVFGEAELGGSLAVVSTCRLRQEFYGNAPDEQLFKERSRKEAVHEIGHVIGLRHCANPVCVMHFSNSVVDTDIKSERPCESCESLLRTSLAFRGRFVRGAR